MLFFDSNPSGTIALLDMSIGSKSQVSSEPFCVSNVLCFQGRTKCCTGYSYFGLALVTAMHFPWRTGGDEFSKEVVVSA